MIFPTSCLSLISPPGISALHPLTGNGSNSEATTLGLSIDVFRCLIAVIIQLKKVTLKKASVFSLMVNWQWQ